MAADSTIATKTTTADKKTASNPHVTRETVESIIVAFILAFLFRAFVAEAFVIPTGSMAPTLMGAHKDTICEYCGTQYQSTASHEFNNREPGLLTNSVAIGSTCASCRASNAFDLAGNRNHGTFSGDRILVSKFDYLFRDPQRWDVLVFKFPTDARMNYIKRLVGLPGERLRIEGGDVYIRKQDSDPWQLARKPPHKVMAMMQVVSDTRHQARDLVAKGWPSLWQPPQPTAAWQIEQRVSEPPDKDDAIETRWSARLDNEKDSEQTQWLRYYHKYLDRELWSEVSGKRDLPEIDPRSTNLITDFLAYNTTKFGPRNFIYDPDGRLNPEITSTNRAIDTLDPSAISYEGLTGLAQDGLHWVGDLAAEFDVDVQSPTGTLSCDLVEFGIHYRCDIDVATGKATLVAIDGAANSAGAGTPGNEASDPKAQQPQINVFAVDESTTVVTPTATTAVRGQGRHRIRFANIDDQLMLWIDGSLVTFDHSTAFDSHRFRTAAQRRPYWTAADPLDAAPIAIGGQKIQLTVHRAQVWRDIYYIAIRPNVYSDYDRRDLETVIESIEDAQLRNELKRDRDGPIDAITWIYAHPQLWSSTPLFSKRGFLEYALKEGEFFPMGDNSAASSDARDWPGHHYVERRFLIGKALLVFWPHVWVSPFPHPNFERMGRIR